MSAETKHHQAEKKSGGAGFFEMFSPLSPERVSSGGGDLAAGLLVALFGFGPRGGHSSKSSGGNKGHH